MGSIAPDRPAHKLPSAGARNSTITAEKITKYLETTRKAFAKVTVVAPPRSFAAKMAENFLDMAKRYYEDAKHSHAQGDDVQAFAQVNYAHGWLDAGARLGIFDVGQDDVLFTLLD
ncbi:MAG: uncharacterized protein QOJ26_1560 [Thermoplasmata archaeon]|jgi:hypothetical protein|nr:uncharacterized protein [Thermoplasmata archaeon]